MRAPPRLGFRGFVLTLAALVLASCAASTPSPDTQAGETETAADAQPAAPASNPQATPSTPNQQSAPPATTQKKMRTGGPLPPERIADKGAVAIDTTCKTDADCTVKNVGNCCGYYPACVNVDSPTDPQGVQARCAKEGMASVCGFQEISACSCKQGHCEAESSEVVQ